MNLVFITNARFTQNNKGEVFGIHTSINKNTFNHYLKVFNKIIVVGRVEITDDIDYSKAVRLDSDKISILPLPYFIGLKGYIFNNRKVKKLLINYLSIDAAIILRVPGSFGRMSAIILKKMKKPFGVEVAGDPWDLYAPKTFNHPLRSLLRYQGYFSLKRTVSKTSAAIYVTKNALQNRYPTKKNTYSTFASNVLIKKEEFKSKPNLLLEKEEYTLISIGTLDQMYKGPDDLLKAILILKNNFNLFVKLKWLGEGKYKNELINRSIVMGIGDRVEFMGSIKPKQMVIDMLDESDIFVLASRTEGLPRALIEAMSRGLPCISTNVGGIPELLNSSELVSKNDSVNLAKKTFKVLSNFDYANKLAKDNLIKSYEYEYELINERRIDFYKYVKSLTMSYKNN
ncbi:MAG: glycosyltransferase family 4 protein [Flavobacteriaceae bacterium]|nr:glycosyltransferase family 4 protein [Flavobacteriaceae bacterium]